jgi:biotin synthase
MCAAARIAMPQARVRLSREAQTLCFLAGANSIFYGENS